MVEQTQSAGDSVISGMVSEKFYKFSKISGGVSFKPPPRTCIDFHWLTDMQLVGRFRIIEMLKFSEFLYLKVHLN